MVFVPDATMFLYPHVYKSLSYDLFRDFTPVTRVIGMSLAMFMGPAVPVIREEGRRLHRLGEG